MKKKAKAAKTKEEKRQEKEQRQNDKKAEKNGEAGDIVLQQVSLKDVEWLEDFSWAVDQGGFFLVASGHSVDKCLKPEVQLCLQRSLRLLWRKTTTCQGKEITAWSVMKKEIIKYIVEKSRGWLQSVKPQAADDSMSAEPMGVANLDDNLLAFRDFIVEWSANPNTLMHMRLRYRKALEFLKDSMADEDLSCLTLRDLCRHVMRAVDEVIDPILVQLMAAHASGDGKSVDPAKMRSR